MALRYKLEMQMRGYYQVGPLLLESGDLFGLHRRYRVETEPHYVLVYPKIVPLQGYDLASRRRIHPAYLWGTPVIVFFQFLRGAVGATAAWQAIARII